MWYTRGFCGLPDAIYLCTDMYISTAKKYRRKEDGSYEPYDYYRLTRSYRDSEGRTRKASVLCLGTLDGFTADDRDRLADILTRMIEMGQYELCDNEVLYEKALEMYAKYRESKYARENDPLLKAELERKRREQMRDAVSVKINTLTQHEARSVGAENLCRSTLCQLGLERFLYGKGWSREDVDIAMMQIIARAIYPYSELKTVRYLHDNSALAEMFHVKREKLTKDTLYKSARRLWDIHTEMEDWLHSRVCDMFNIEEKILLFDITNTYFEGRMEDSEICAYGRSKEKRTDCKIVVLAAVVNTDGLIVRTMIYEVNRADCTTLKEVVGSLAAQTSAEARKVVVMDAGFYTEDNAKRLVNNHFDYITVLPVGATRFVAADDNIVRHEDCRHQEIRLQKGTVEIDGSPRNALLVDSDAKALKERSMYNQAVDLYEQGLRDIKAGIEKKGGTKRRDAVNKRIGRLDEKFGAIRKNFTVSFEYEGAGNKEKVVSMTWERNAEKSGEVQKFHGKYVLITNMDEDDELTVWKLYNVIRMVEETFHVLKTDLDIRPVYHKSDDGIKAHLNLAVLAYWVVSVTKYRLRLKAYDNVRWDEILRIASTQVVVTAKMETASGNELQIRQCTEAEKALTNIYALLGINLHPVPKRQSVVHPKPPRKNPPPD